jgi:hypothetical protein
MVVRHLEGIRIGKGGKSSRNKKTTDEFCGFLSIFSAEPLFYKGLMVGRARLELATNGLKVRCSTD